MLTVVCIFSNVEILFLHSASQTYRSALECKVNIGDAPFVDQYRLETADPVILI